MTPIRTIWLSLVLAFSFAASSANADLIITLGSNAQALLPDTNNQRVDLFVTSTAGESIDGVQLNMFLGDGTGAGIEPVFAGTPGTTEGIVFADSDSIFAGLANDGVGGQGPIENFPQFAQVSFVLSSGVQVDNPNGKFATLLIDTTGFVGGSVDLTLGGGNGLPTSFFSGPNVDQSTNVVFPGSSGALFVTAIPEPSMLVACGAFATTLSLRRRRRRPQA